MKAILWSKPGCGYCTMAETLLKSKNIEIDERKLGFGWNREQLFESVPTAKTLPQIFLDGKYIGGYTELKKYFDEITVFSDNDDAGNQMRDDIMDGCRGKDLYTVKYPDNKKDPGEMTQQEIITTLTNKIIGGW